MPSLTYIDKLANGDKLFKQRLIAVIKEELPIEIQLYQDCLKINDFECAAKGVHRIKHKMAILSYEDGYLIADDHENALKIGKSDFVKDFESVLLSITEYANLL